MRNLFTYFGVFCLLISPTYAQGLAMHGNPKYGPESTHLTYANPDAPKGGMLKQASIGSFDTVNPYAIKGKAADGLNLVYDRLMRRVWDEPFTMYPLIAQRAEIAEDRSSVTFHLNPKARFSDGSAITAADVLFSFETLKNEGRPNMRRIYRLATKANITEDGAVHFAFGEGKTRETVMIFAMMPVLSKTYWQDRSFDSTTLDIPITNGPYKIKEIDPGRKITYERDPDYWAKDLFFNVGHFNFNEVVYEYYRDNTVALEAFKKGNLNFRREWDAGKWNSAYDALSPDITKEALPHGRPDRVRGFIFNTRRAPFDDGTLREALSYLFDFDWVNTNLFYKQHRQITSFYPNTDLAASNAPPAEKDMRVRLRTADALLKEAGWSVENGMRVKGGSPLTFDILLDNPHNEKIALALTRNLEKMGIKATVRVKDTSAFLDQLRNYDFDVVLHYWTSTLSPGTEQYLYWSCEAANTPNQWNYAGICDPEIDALTKKIADAKDRQELISLTQALDKKLMAAHMMIPLYYNPQDYVAYRTPIRRPKITPLYGLVAETWWMDGT